MENKQEKEKVNESVGSAIGSTEKTTEQSKDMPPFVMDWKRSLVTPSNKIYATHYFGGVQIALVSLLTALVPYFLMGRIASSLGGFSSRFADHVNELRTGLLFRGFFMVAIFYACLVGLVYLSAKICSKEKINFLGIMNQFGGLMTVNQLLLVIATLLVFMAKHDSSEPFVYTLFALYFGSFLVGFLGFNYLLFDILRQKSRFSVLYVMTVNALIILTIFSVIIYQQLEPIMELI